MKLGGPFQFLRIAATLFKVLAWLVLILMLVGVAGILVGMRGEEMPLPFPVILNMFFSGAVGFLVFFSLGEVIRLLLSLEAQTRKP